MELSHFRCPASRIRFSGIRSRRALVTIIAWVFPLPLWSQVSVVGVRDVLFGAIAPGVTATVLPGDPVKSGQWTITAVAGSQILIRMTVPSQLIGPGGATMPVVFRNGDAFLQGSWTGARAVTFNPGGAMVFKFSGGPQAIVRLGGRVTPAATQATGAYANTVVVTINILH